MIIGVLMTLNGRQWHIHSVSAARFSSEHCIYQSFELEFSSVKMEAALIKTEDY